MRRAHCGGRCQRLYYPVQQEGPSLEPCPQQTVCQRGSRQTGMLRPKEAHSLAQGHFHVSYGGLAPGSEYKLGAEGPGLGSGDFDNVELESAVPENGVREPGFHFCPVPLTPAPSASLHVTPLLQKCRKTATHLLLRNFAKSNWIVSE